MTVIFIDHDGVIYQNAMNPKANVDDDYVCFEIFVTAHIERKCREVTVSLKQFPRKGFSTDFEN